MVKKHVSDETEEYELLPHKEIEELKEELQKLKEFEITPTKKLRISLIELNNKLDKLLQIFDEARKDIRTEEIGLGFKEKIKPVLEKIDTILEQQSDIAEGMVALSDIVKGIKKEAREEPEFSPPKQFLPEEPLHDFSLPKPGMGPPVPPSEFAQRQQNAPPMPPGPRAYPPRPGMPLPPPPRKKRFGIL